TIMHSPTHQELATVGTCFQPMPLHACRLLQSPRMIMLRLPAPLLLSHVGRTSLPLAEHSLPVVTRSRLPVAHSRLATEPVLPVVGLPLLSIAAPSRAVPQFLAQAACAKRYAYLVPISSFLTLLLCKSSGFLPT